jgi:hypothetical protein
MVITSYKAMGPEFCKSSADVGPLRKNFNTTFRSVLLLQFEGARSYVMMSFRLCYRICGFLNRVISSPKHSARNHDIVACRLGAHCYATATLPIAFPQQREVHLPEPLPRNSLSERRLRKSMNWKTRERTWLWPNLM